MSTKRRNQSRVKSAGEPPRHPNPIPRAEQAEVRRRIIASEPEGFLTQEELDQLLMRRRTP